MFVIGVIFPSMISIFFYWYWQFPLMNWRDGRMTIYTNERSKNELSISMKKWESWIFNSSWKLFSISFNFFKEVFIVSCLRKSLTYIEMMLWCNHDPKGKWISRTNAVYLIKLHTHVWKHLLDMFFAKLTFS